MIVGIASCVLHPIELPGTRPLVGNIVILRCANNLCSRQKTRIAFLPDLCYFRCGEVFGKHLVKMPSAKETIEIKRMAQLLRFHTFGKHHEVRLDCLNPTSPLFPEVDGDFPCHITPISVHIESAYEIFHICEEIFPQRREDPFFINFFQSFCCRISTWLSFFRDFSRFCS